MVDYLKLWPRGGRVTLIDVDNDQGQPTPAVLFDLPLAMSHHEAAHVGTQMMRHCGWDPKTATGDYDPSPATGLELDLAGGQVRLRGLESFTGPIEAEPNWLARARLLGGISVGFTVLDPDPANYSSRYEQAYRAGRLWGGWINLVEVHDWTAASALDVSLPFRTGMTPASLPRAREATAAWVAASSRPGGGTGFTIGTGEDDGEDLAAAMAATLEGASLWWASRDMTVLTATGQRTFPEARLDDLVDRRGMFVFDGGLALPATGQTIDAISWASGADGATITVWAHRRRWPAELRDAAEARGQGLPPFIPLALGRLSGTRFGPGDLDAETEAFVTVCCAGALIERSSAVTRSTERPPKRHRQAARRSGRNLPDVAVIDILRSRRGAEEARETTDAAGRTYTHQWIVQGHWRQQVCGPGRTQRQRIWIEPYFKGPADAPLRSCERVNLWKR